jgi:hypothetical protein
MTVPPIHVIIPVWGAAYTRFFLEIGLPSLLAPGNLPALSRADGHLMHIFTTAADRDTIVSSSAWTLTQSLLDCRIDVMGRDLVVVGQPHLTMSNCHREAIAYADTRAAAMMFYNPDIVLADGGMAALVRLLERGKRAIQVVGLRLLKEEVVPLLMERHVAHDGTAIVVSPRELMALAMRHLHPISKMHLYDESGLDLMPQEVFWRAGEEGLVARCFHIHPILVYPRVPNAPFTTTVDDDYLRAACPDADDEYVIADSDEFCLCELSAMQRGVTGLPRTMTDLDIARWAWTNARPHHFEHFCRRIILHAGRNNEAEWQAAAARSDDGVARILDYALEMTARATRGN